MKDPTRSLSEPGFGAALSSHKLRARAGAGLGEMSSEIGPARLFQTEPEDLLAPQPRHVVTVADVTRGLGLEATVSDRVQRMVVGSNVQYTPRAGQQRLASGRSYLIEALRVLIPAADVRGEVTRRALALWRKTQSTDGMRSPTMRTVIKAEQFFAAPRARLVLLRKSGDGQERAGHKYLHRKPDGKGGWTYAYSSEAAAADRISHAQAQHDAAKDALFSAAREGKTTPKHGTDFADSSQALADAQAGKPDRERAASLRDESEKAEVASDEAYAGKRTHQSAANAHWKMAERYRLLGHHGFIKHESMAEDHERQGAHFASREKERAAAAAPTPKPKAKKAPRAKKAARE